jgi:hypothetical protein
MNMCGKMEGTSQKLIVAYMNKGKGKAEVVPVPFLTEHHAMRVYWGGVIAPRILRPRN